MTRSAIYYGLFFAGLGSIYPFLPLLLEHRGLRASQIGVAMVMFSVAKLALSSVWGAVADATKSRERFLFLLPLGTVVGLWGLGTSHSFIALTISIAAFSAFAAPVATMADSVVRPLVANQYGRIRLWGSVGFSLAVYLSGALGGAKEPALLAAIAGTLYVMAAVTAWPLAFSKTKQVRERYSPKELWRSLKNAVDPSVAVFFIGTIVYYTSHTINDVYLTIHLSNSGLAMDAIGFLVAIGVIAEVILMWFLPRISLSFSPAILLIICTGAAVFRWHAITLVDSFWGFFVVQLLHGLTFGIWYPSVVARMDDAADDTVRTTMQSLAALCIGLGMFIGNLGGGRLVEFFGTVAVYQLATVVASVAVILYAISWRWQMGLAKTQG